MKKIVCEHQDAEVQVLFPGDQVCPLCSCQGKAKRLQDRIDQLLEIVQS